ncbi:hypothetical protein Tco_0495757 [Tanacetum coccineum]
MPTNNWASALKSTYAPPQENSLLAQTGDMATFMDWYCKQKGISELTPKDLEGPAFEIVKVFHPDVIHLQFQMEECHKLLTDQVDDAILRYNVSKPLPLGGEPGHVTIQPDFFFNKDLEYLRYGRKVGRPALSISKMKAAYYPDVGLEQLVPDQFWIEEECKYDIAAMYGISHWWFQKQRFYIDRFSSKGDRRAVRTYMRILSVVRIEVFSMYGYNYMKKIVIRRADLKEYIIAERDFKYINLVIRHRVEDFQLGNESYQTQLNLTKPRWEATGFEFKHDYTVIDSPRHLSQDRFWVQNDHESFHTYPRIKQRWRWRHLVPVESIHHPMLTLNVSNRQDNTQPADHDDSNMPELTIFNKPQKGIFDEASYDDEGMVHDFNNLPTEVAVSPIPTLKIHNIHPQSQILGDPKSSVQLERNLKRFLKLYKMTFRLKLCKRSCYTLGCNRRGSRLDYVIALARIEAISVKTAITPMETKMALTKDEEADDVYVTPKTSHLNAMKRVFKYLKGKPNLGLWYPRESSFDLEATQIVTCWANLDRIIPQPETIILQSQDPTHPRVQRAITMTVEDLLAIESQSKRTKKQISEEQASLAEIARLQAQEEAENARKTELLRQGALITKRMQDELELFETQKNRMAQVQEAANYYTEED